MSYSLLSAPGDGFQTQEAFVFGNLNVLTNLGITGIGQFAGNLNKSGNGQISLVSADSAFTLTGAAASTLSTTGTSSQLSILSAANAGSNGSIFINATDTTSGSIRAVAAGAVANAISLSATNANSATTVTMASAGTGASAMVLSTSSTTSTLGLSAAGSLSLQSSNTSSGINIGTVTAGVPVNIGTSTSTTTFAGPVIMGNTVTTSTNNNVFIGDNVITLNTSGAATGLPAGLEFTRFQPVGTTVTGDVTSGRSQESGTTQAGGTTTTAVLSASASSTDSFYNGWHGTVTISATTYTFRILSYVGSTRTATFVAAIAVSVTAGNAYVLYSATESAFVWNETTDQFEKITSAAQLGSSLTRQQYAPVAQGTTDIEPLVFTNVPVTTSGSSTTVNLTNAGFFHGTYSPIVGHRINITATVNSTGLTGTITNGIYTITAVSNPTITFTHGTAITATAPATVAVELTDSSQLSVNRLVNLTAGASLAFTGAPLVIDNFPITAANGTTWLVISSSVLALTFGALRIHAYDTTNTTTGSFSVADIVRGGNAGGNATATAVAATTAGNYRIQFRWSATFPEVRHQIASTATITYRFIIYGVNS